MYSKQACRDARDRLLPSLSIIDSQYAPSLRSPWRASSACFKRMLGEKHCSLALGM
ncbi:hypothetical protein [Candidiatus Paracoxiella cheracis]|uniref:hypothetical protein n=1 Tax=Candidiatus Paracoxiella cheracis TaxID=3405120 RepID=UPI003BF4D7CB